jgi:membrane-associated protease RseP (regulator of RpoE activity)
MTRSLPLLLTLTLSGGAALAHPKHGNRTMFWTMSGGGRLGVEVTGMTDELRKFFGTGADAGVLISRVEADSPAAKAGLRVGDVVVQADGQTIDDPSDLVGATVAQATGAQIKLGLVRDHKPLSLSATLRDPPGGEAQGFALSTGQPGRVHQLEAFNVAPMWGGDPDGLRKELDRTREALRALEKRLDRLEQQKH